MIQGEKEEEEDDEEEVSVMSFRINLSREPNLDRHVFRFPDSERDRYSCYFVALLDLVVGCTVYGQGGPRFFQQSQSTRLKKQQD